MCTMAQMLPKLVRIRLQMLQTTIDTVSGVCKQQDVCHKINKEVT